MIEKRIISSAIQTEWTLYGSIKGPDNFKELIKDLEEAHESDVIVLKINSPGGWVCTGNILVKAIQGSSATVIAHVVHYSASMASLIALACDGLILDKHTHLMFHTYSGGTAGKSDDILQDVTETNRCITGIMRDLAYPFLTKKELDKMMDGKDIYIRWDDEDLLQRIKRHFKYTPSAMVK